MFPTFQKLKTCWRRQLIRHIRPCDILNKLQEHVKGKKIIRQGECLYCPHKGFPLHNAETFRGLIECPGQANLEQNDW